VKIKIGLVDDHQLFLKSLSLMLETLNFQVVLEALNGKDLQERINTKKEVPDIMVIDVNMPVMDGIETASWLQNNHPSIKLVALSMNGKENAIIKMFKAGCCAYLLKDTHPTVLEKAMHEVYTNGYYNADLKINFKDLLRKADENFQLNITANELQFLKLASSDLTYKQIAFEMKKSERTVDGYRESLFEKFQVQSRVGLCLEALRRELISL
jgi:DNA-binding NarL/FixJ family response regulator